MTITLTSREFDEAVSLWLEDQGFSPDSYNITTRVIAGRSDGPLGTRLEVTLDAKPRESRLLDPMFARVSLGQLSAIRDAPVVDRDVGPIPMPTTMMPTSSFSQRASQGHADE